MAGKRDKQRKIREQRKILLIIIERGNQTERIYFNKFIRRNSIVQIEIPNCKITEAVKLIEYARAKAKEYAIDIGEGDKVWCVFDVDAKGDPELEKTKQLADKNGIKMALSNPSFELWFLLHTDYNSTRPFSDNDHLLRELKVRFPAYKKTNDYMFNSILLNQQQAIDKAKELIKYHTECGRRLCSKESNPCTHVFELVEYINYYC
ncbi:RloB-like protein [Syntrophomonas zehnderi OL-4]|uniref:RloB-like protein n=1 Tax=Syntrophomonas zehnderi OL-4 TaxID=690567 RepID=A0A0E4C7T1_9FIRM|nr:RloB family protein [Syntrophomonas zehnderi]CFX12670.1 RloB-like protein [Syntrophomonas zehnderi OL-4]